MIFRIPRTTVELVGEGADEWQRLEKLVRLGQRTTGPRTDESRLRQLASELLRVPLRVGGIAVLRTRSRVRTRDLGSA
jgi:hypothetical protein